jgi:uncharacterized protein (TIGR04255 family)
MSEHPFKLPNPPIVEAVLDIECDLPPGQHVTEIEAPALERLRDQYPKFRHQFMQEHMVEVRPPQPARQSTRQWVQALQFLKEDEKQLVQVRAQGYSFNRLAPYTSLDDYLPEIERTWRLYLELVKPLKVRLIRLRYINRILLPLTEGRVQLDDYFTVAPRLPDEENLTLAGFLNQHIAIEGGTGHQVALVLAAQPAEPAHLPVIFDNGVTSPEPGEPDNWPWILAKIRVLRELKNRMFRRAVTDKCLDLFQ